MIQIVLDEKQKQGNNKILQLWEGRKTLQVSGQEYHPVESKMLISQSKWPHLIFLAYRAQQENKSSQASEHFTFIKATKLTERGLETTQGR